MDKSSLLHKTIVNSTRINTHQNSEEYNAPMNVSTTSNTIIMSDELTNTGINYNTVVRWYSIVCLSITLGKTLADYLSCALDTSVLSIGLTLRSK